MKLTTTLTIALILSLGLNMFYFSKSDSDSDLKKRAFCSEFKEQASKRIDTWYSNGDQINIYPSEIFYSPVEDTCIAVWGNLESLPNGTSQAYVIFDAISNQDYFSGHVLHVYGKTEEKREQERNSNIRRGFSDELLRLKSDE
jgi:predicted phosphodiesterase